MANLILNGSTSGSVTLSSPAVSGTTTLTLPVTSGTVLTSASSIATSQLSGSIASSSLPAGSVLQVVSAAKTDTFSTTSTSMVDVTGLSVSITPSSTSNKIIILYQLNGGVDPNVQGIFMQLARDSTAIFIGDAASSRPRNTCTIVPISQYGVQTASGSFLDSPSTTSSTTYKIQMMVNGGGGNLGYVNRSVADRNTSLYDPRTSSSITVMEVKG
jgi:hypothetical protein